MITTVYQKVCHGLPPHFSVEESAHLDWGKKKKSCLAARCGGSVWCGGLLRYAQNNTTHHLLSVWKFVGHSAEHFLSDRCSSCTDRVATPTTGCKLKESLEVLQGEERKNCCLLHRIIIKKKNHFWDKVFLIECIFNIFKQTFNFWGEIQHTQFC